VCSVVGFELRLLLSVNNTVCFFFNSASAGVAASCLDVGSVVCIGAVCVVNDLFSCL
jgi:hypothetical protein